MPTDLDDLDPEDVEADVTDSKRASSEKPTTDYKAKYQGMQREFERLRKRHDALRSEYDSLVSSSEKELSDLRNSFKDPADQLKAKNDEIARLTRERDDAANKLAGFETARTTRSLVAKEYPDLLDAFDADDLRPRTQFADDAAYTAYLGRMAERMGIASASERQAEDEETERVVERVRGTTPAAAATSRERHKPRTRQQIAVEMDKVDPDSPRYRALEEEMESAVQ